MVCFVDESGNLRRCGTLCVAIVCFDRVEGKPVDSYGRDLVDEIRRNLGVSMCRELKYRIVKRIAKRLSLDVAQLVSMIVDRCRFVSSKCVHLDDPYLCRKRGLVEVLRTACIIDDVALVVLDENLVAGRDRDVGYVKRFSGCVRRIRFGSSHRFPGIQLADLVAGFCRENYALCVSMDIA